MEVSMPETREPKRIPAEATKPFRILVTGSRAWDDWVTVWTALEDAIEEAYRKGRREYVVVHGGAKGADQIAADFCEDQAGWYDDYANQVLAVERHPADWDKHGKAAGPIRNQAMVDLGADVCLAFQIGDSRGTADCIRRAEKAGIPIRRYVRSSRA
jgi:hypothetical protein